MCSTADNYIEAIQTFSKASDKEKCATVLHIMKEILKEETQCGWKKLRITANDITLVENHFREKYDYEGDVKDAKNLKPLIEAALLFGARVHLSVTGMHRTLIRRIGMFYLDRLKKSEKEIDKISLEDRARRINNVVLHDLYKYSLDEFLGYSLKWGGVDWTKFKDNTTLQEMVDFYWSKGLAHHYRSYAHHPENKDYLSLDDYTWEKMCDNVAVHIQKSLLKYTDGDKGSKTQVPVAVAQLTNVQEFFWPKDAKSRGKYIAYLDSLRQFFEDDSSAIATDIGLVVTEE